jgi:hypothetical protein
MVLHEELQPVQVIDSGVERMFKQPPTMGLKAVAHGEDPRVAHQNNLLDWGRRSGLEKDGKC